MKIQYQNKEQITKELQGKQYAVAIIHKNGEIAYVGLKNRFGYPSHEPLFKSMNAIDSIADYYRYTFDVQQGVVVRTPTDINVIEFWKKLSVLLSKELNLEISNHIDVIG